MNFPQGFLRMWFWFSSDPLRCQSLSTPQVCFIGIHRPTSQGLHFQTACPDETSCSKRGDTLWPVNSSALCSNTMLGRKGVQ